MSMGERLLNWLNVVLMANVALVLLSFAWLAVAVAGQAAHLSLGLELWYRLWQPLFQPAIGILMAGAILSGIASWLRKRLRQIS
jgi:TRAP-type C4-dicarboxylate transport system permease small subunit